MNPRVAAMESEAVRWIRYCSVNDANWKSALARLTDEELGYCLRWERRKTGMEKLQAEANRRGLGLLFLDAMADRMDRESKGNGTGWEDPPLPPEKTSGAEEFSDPYVGPSGDGRVFLTMRSSRAGRKCIGRKFESPEAAMARARELMGGEVIDIGPEETMTQGQSAEVRAVEEVYQLGRKEADKATAILESERFDCEAIGKIKAANFNTKANELLKYVTLHQVKQSKEYRRAGRSWEEFCRDIGEAQRSVDRILDDLSPILEKISANLAEILGMPLSKIRYLGRSVSANLAEITDNAIVIADQRIEIVPENRDELEAAIDLMKESHQKERETHSKEVEKLKKRLENAATEETKALTAERDALVKEITRLKVFDPEGKSVDWSRDQMQKIGDACSDFVILCRKFILDDRLDDQIELQAEVEKFMNIAEMSLRDLREQWDERFNASFGD